MPRAHEEDFLVEVLQGCAPAVEFCQIVFRISQTLDDLIDKDRAVTDGDIVSAFWQAMIELPVNPFYRTHELYLRPLLAGALQDWRDSVILERRDDWHSRTLAFVLRDQLTSVVVQCAYLVGGEQWMAQIGPEVRDHFHEDTLGTYLNSL